MRGAECCTCSPFHSSTCSLDPAPRTLLRELRPPPDLELWPIGRVAPQPLRYSTSHQPTRVPEHASDAALDSTVWEGIFSMMVGNLPPHLRQAAAKTELPDERPCFCDLATARWILIMPRPPPLVSIQPTSRQRTQRSRLLCASRNSSSNTLSPLPSHLTDSFLL